MKNTPSEMLTAYLRAFETLRPDEVIPFYHLPCMLISPDGDWVVQDEATALVLAGHLVEHAKAQGYHRTEVPECTLRALASELAELSGVFVRYDASQSEVSRFGFTYIVRGDSDRWKIVVAVAHDARTEASPLLPVAGDRTGGERRKTHGARATSLMSDARPNNSMQRPALRAAADAERWAARGEDHPIPYSDKKSDGCSRHLANLATTQV